MTGSRCEQVKQQVGDKGGALPQESEEPYFSPWQAGAHWHHWQTVAGCSLDALYSEFVTWEAPAGVETHCPAEKKPPERPLGGSHGVAYL